jgi:hypothetical protein
MAVKERLADLGNYDCKLMLHSCGGIEPFIDDYVEMGVDVLDPVQTRAKRMNALHLKQTFGNRISFHGGLTGGYPMQRRRRSDRRNQTKAESLACGGGYILCQTHNVQLTCGRAVIRWSKWRLSTAAIRSRRPLTRSIFWAWLLDFARSSKGAAG